MEKLKTLEDTLALDMSELYQKGENPTGQTATSNAYPDESVETIKTADEGDEYVTGFKLAIVMLSVTLVAFLMLLDTTIIVTVSQLSMFNSTDFRLLLMIGLGYSSDHHRFSLSQGCGMVWQRVSFG